MSAVLPKAELHLHIGARLSPELMFELARRNGVRAALERASRRRAPPTPSKTCRVFSTCITRGRRAGVLEDFFDLAMAYFPACRSGWRGAAESWFDPQTHTAQGRHETVLNGLRRACATHGVTFDISSRLILGFAPSQRKRVSPR